MKFRNLALSAAGVLLLALNSLAQTTSLQGDVKGEDGKPIQNAVIKIDRKDIKGNYKVKTDKKGHFFHAGLPLGMYKVTCEVDGKDVDSFDNIRTRLGDNPPIMFDLAAAKTRAEAGAAGVTNDQLRGMSAADKAALEKSLKDRESAMKKNKELNDTFNLGMTALQAKNYDEAVAAFEKAGALDANQHVVWAQLAEAYSGQASAKTGADADALMAKGLEAYGKALALKPDDAAYHNNFALALAKAKKFPEAQAELTKAAEIDAPNAGRYYYNLGAVLVNIGQNDQAGDAFKKAIELQPDYADAQYQYGVYLMSKAQIAADGKITPVPGTKEAFDRYLQLKPDGPFAEAAKAMLTSMGASIDTSYKNPNAPAPKSAAPKKK